MIHQEQFLLNFVLFVLFFVGSRGQDGPIANTRYGELQGRTYETERGTVNGWLGIPYAAPPTGSARFELPSRPSQWRGRRTATQFAARCPQLPLFPVKYGENENCLFLNVFSPAAKADSTGYPVLFWVHGGGFMMGSADQYDGEGIAENLASRGVVVVTINYRLGAFGFFAIENSDYSGNYAIHDAIEALRWVRENINAFGGNPNRVTIFGESAGGTLVSMLNHIPTASSLFHQVIAQSGSAFAEWLISGQSGNPDASVQTSTELIKRLGCFAPTLNDTMNCMREVSAEKLLGAASVILMEGMGAAKSNLAMLKPQLGWRPRIDGILITEEFKLLSKASPSRPYITGVCQEEELLFSKPMISIFKNFTSPVEIKNDSLITKEYIKNELALYMSDKTNKEILL